MRPGVGVGRDRRPGGKVVGTVHDIRKSGVIGKLQLNRPIAPPIIHDAEQPGCWGDDRGQRKLDVAAKAGEREHADLKCFPGGAVKDHRLVWGTAGFVLRGGSVAAINNKFILPAAFHDEQRPPASRRRVPLPPDVAIQRVIVVPINRIRRLASR